MGLVIIGDGGHARDILALTPGARVIPHHSEWDGVSEYIIGINDPHVRAKVAADLGGPGFNRGRFVHPTAYLGTSYHPDQGLCFIGDGTHINYGSQMTRTELGEYVTIAPGVTICGDVVIGDRVFIGAGAVIKNLVTIGDDAFICMGAIVTRDVEPGERYKGRT